MRFYIGNIVKLPSGSVVIITGSRTGHDSRKLWDWVSFSSSNVSGSTTNETYTKREMCWDCDTNVYPEYPNDECMSCGGSGYNDNYEVVGMDKAEYLASNAKSYIMDILTNKKVLD